jgi:N-acetylglucosamine kinase-like BadF-type ATPase
LRVAYFLGIDGGGTKTSCLVGDETNILGRATSGGSNIVPVGEANAREALAQVIRKACQAANITPEQIEHVCIGTAGAGAPKIATIIRSMAREAGITNAQVVGDTVTTLHAAFGSGPGVVIVAGTGSVAYGRNASGETSRAGGYGFTISDEGSAQWIGRTAVSAALRSRDEGGDTTLLKQLLRTWSCNSPEELVIAANRPAAKFSSLAPLVSAAADSGDVLARNVLTLAARELAGLVSAVAHRLFSPRDPVPVAMSGGVFANCPLVRETFHSALLAQLPRAEISPEIAEPVLGALQLARQAKAE